MELTAAQRQIVEHGGGPLRVGGGPGCGKTTALVRRYLRLVAGGARPSSVLVVCHDRAAATRFRNTVLPALTGGFDSLPITTWFGVAFDLVTRERGPVRLLSSAEQRALVRRLLGGESPAHWPEYGHYLGRATFADEVAGALLRPEAAGCPELDRFAQRYDAVLAERHEVDRARLIAQAAAVAQRGRYAHVLVDDHHVAMNDLLAAVSADAVVVSDEPPADVTLDEPFRRPAAGVLITCRHPSTEAEAVAGELLAARSEGVAWSDMAVLVGDASRRRRSVARALSRHGIPVAPGPALGAGAGDPAVAAIVDVLRWAAGDVGALGRLLVSPVSVLGKD
ncbi:MAG TPA: UvrD-helicase domain-containing protein, partial [Acidimicrobiales bacterium]|nr:UvrD-helicase domain-containing protein [Acidimicrobiales bacterium]